MTELSAQQQRLWSLWFGLMGGPVVYSLYFLAVYFLGEAACLADLLRYRVLGLEAIAFWVLLLTVVTAVVIGYGAWLAYGNWQQTTAQTPDDGASYAAFMAFVGLWLSALFTVLTVATGLPALFLVLCDWI